MTINEMTVLVVVKGYGHQRLGLPFTDLKSLEYWFAARLYIRGKFTSDEAVDEPNLQGGLPAVPYFLCMSGEEKDSINEALTPILAEDGLRIDDPNIPSDVQDALNKFGDYVTYSHYTKIAEEENGIPWIPERLAACNQDVAAAAAAGNGDLLLTEMKCAFQVLSQTLGAKKYIFGAGRGVKSLFDAKFAAFVVTLSTTLVNTDVKRMFFEYTNLRGYAHKSLRKLVPPTAVPTIPTYLRLKEVALAGATQIRGGQGVVSFNRLTTQLCHDHNLNPSETYVLKRSLPSSNAANGELLWEDFLLRHCSYPPIVRIAASTTDWADEEGLRVDDLYVPPSVLVLQRIQGDTLDKVLLDDRLSGNEVLGLLADIGYSFHCLEISFRSLIYCDPKLNNFMYDYEAKKGMLIDLGHVVEEGSPFNLVSHVFTRMTITVTGRGAQHYENPKVARRANHKYALGVLIFAMVSNWMTNEDAFETRVKGFIREAQMPWIDGARDIIRPSLWERGLNNSLAVEVVKLAYRCIHDGSREIGEATYQIVDHLQHLRKQAEPSS